MAIEAKKDCRYQPEVVFPPGETLNERLEDIGMAPDDLATRTGLSTEHINQIILGAAAVTAEAALLLECATRTPAQVWSDLETAYREFLSCDEGETPKIEGV